MDDDENLKRAIRESLEEKLRDEKEKLRDEKEYEEIILEAQIASLQDHLKQLNRKLTEIESEQIIVEPMRKKQRIAKRDFNVYYSHGDQIDNLMKINAMECGGEGDCFYYSLAYALNQLGYTVSNSSDEPLIGPREIGKIAGRALVTQMMNIRGLLFNEILKITEETGLAGVEDDINIIFRKKSPVYVRRASAEAEKIANRQLKKIQKGDENKLREVRNQGNMIRDNWINEYSSRPFKDRLYSVAQEHGERGTYATQPVMSLFIPILNLIQIAGFYVIVTYGNSEQHLFRFEKRETQEQNNLSDRFLLFINYQTKIQHYRLGYWQQENQNGGSTNNYIFTRRGIFTFMGNTMNQIIM